MAEVKKMDSHEAKIACAGCRKEIEACELYYDSESAEVICKICSCNYATFAHQQFEMEEK